MFPGNEGLGGLQAVLISGSREDDRVPAAIIVRVKHSERPDSQPLLLGFGEKQTKQT